MQCKLASAKCRLIVLCLLLMSIHPVAMSQDSAYIKRTDTVKHHVPRLATKYSLMLPGLGQAYNKQYWKIPIVYGILAIPVSTFIYNNDLYNKTKFAYEAKFKATNGDPSDLAKIDPQLTGLSLGSLQSYRNIFRKDRDMSILWFILCWGLNVADATVSGHLKEFDIGSNLAMSIRPTVQPSIQQTGLSLQLHIKNAHGK